MSQFIEMFGGLCQDTPWSDVVTITNGKAYPEEYQEEGAYPICGSGGIMCYGEKKLCNGNTTILGRKGNINNPIFMESGYWIVDTAFSIDVDKAKLHPKFFYYWCCQYDFTKLNKQGILPSLTRKDLEKVKMAIPQMRDQLKFVSIAEQADKSKFGDFKSQFIEMFGNPFEINSEMVPLSSLCSINPFKPKGLDDSLSVSFIPMDRISEDGEYAEFETKPLKDVKKGFTYCAEDDVLFAKITPCMENGKGAILKGLSNGIGFGSTEFHVLRPIWGISNSEWLYFLTKLNGFRIDAAKNMIGTGGQKRVPSSYLLNFKVLQPQLEAQKEFAKIVHQADKSKSVIQKALVYLNDIQSDELGKIA